MRKTRSGGRVVVLTAALLAVLSTGALAATQPWKQAGPRPDGTAVTPVGFRVTPAGAQTNLGDLPLNAVASPDGRWLVAVNAGQGVQSVQVVDTRSGKVTQTIQYARPQAVFAGLAFSKDGTTLYASAGGNNTIRTYSFANGALTEGAALALPTKSASGKKINPYPAGIALTPDGKRLLVADRLADAVTAIDLASGAQQTVGVGHAPYWVTSSPDGTRAWVTDQGGTTVDVLDIGAGKLAPTGQITVGTHPNEAVLDKAGRTLFVANGDSDEISAVDTGTGRVTSTISLAPYRGAQVGSNPVSLALSGDERTLFVANAGNNDVAVVDLRSQRVRGLIPTAWYPTTVLPLGSTLWVTNAKGLGAGPNNGPGYPNPESHDPTSPSQYSGSMMVGTLSAIPLPSVTEHNAADADDGTDGQDAALTEDQAADQRWPGGQLARWTRQVRRDDGFDQRGRAHVDGPSQVVPLHPGQDTPIKHVIYVVKENRTFDQVLGSLGKGDGDKSLNLFGDESAPNSRALARDFVTLDNFYADAEVSAQGWNWTTQANSNPYAETGWPANYSGRNHPYPSENGDPAITAGKDASSSFIWQRLAAAGVSFRNYGFYVSSQNGKFVGSDPVLDANTDHNYRGFDLSCPDSAGTFTAPASCGTPRIDEWLSEFQGYQANGNLPTVEFVRLPNDHTAGTSAGAPTPKAYVADNDLALGRLVDAVSHSKYWQDTAIFATEDDAQNGPDHVDAHRTTAWVVSPYTRTGKVDSTFYSTASVLRTVELLVGVTPLTQFDAYSTPLAPAFTSKPDARPYTALKPTTPLDERNTAASPMATQSAIQNLTVEDAIDEQVFNQAIWQSVHGAGSAMPAPKHTLGTIAGQSQQTPPATDADDDDDH